MNPLVDIVMAYRLAYYCYARPMIGDREYDTAEAEARKLVGPEHALNRPGSDNLEDYPASIRALALYLELRAVETARSEAQRPQALPPKIEEDDFDLAPPVEKAAKEFVEISLFGP